MAKDARQKAIEEANNKAALAETENEPDPELSPEAKAAETALLAALEADDAPEISDPEVDVEDPRALQRDRAKAAHDKLRVIATSYPQTTPNEHIVFGFGGKTFNLGELRDLFGLRRT